MRCYGQRILQAKNVKYCKRSEHMKKKTRNEYRQSNLQ